MPLDDKLITDVAIAAISGDVSDVAYDLRKAEVDLATSSGSADVHVQLEHLTTFYNGLSELHSQLVAQIDGVTGEAQALNSLPAGGAVDGAKRAWAATAQSAGLSGWQSSLLANLKAMDGMVLSHMAALQSNAQEYARNENLAISTLGHAASSAGGQATQQQAATPESGPVEDRGIGIGGK